VDRFSAYLLIRRYLRRPASRNHALVVEAIMQELAARAGEPGEQWGVLGLLSQLDLEYAERNPRARGVTARQQAELEGLAPEQAACLERWCTVHARGAHAPHGSGTLERPFAPGHSSAHLPLPSPTPSTSGATPASPVVAVEDALFVACALGDLALGYGRSQDLELERPEEPELEEPELEEAERRGRRQASRPQLDGDDLARRLGRELELRRQQGDPEGDRLDEALARLQLDGDEAGRLALAGLRHAAEDLR
jgi:hypothetical protein